MSPLLWQLRTSRALWRFCHWPSGFWLSSVKCLSKVVLLGLIQFLLAAPEAAGSEQDSCETRRLWTVNLRPDIQPCASLALTENHEAPVKTPKHSLTCHKTFGNGNELFLQHDTEFNQLVELK